MSALLLSLAVVPAAAGAGDDSSYTAREVQAAFLHSLLFFVQWPELDTDAEAGPVRIGALIEAGGVLRFFESDGRIRIEISRAAAERQGLQISSQPLSQVEVVP